MPAAETLDANIADFEAAFAKEKAANKAAKENAAKDKAAAAANRCKSSVKGKDSRTHQLGLCEFPGAVFAGY